MIYVNCKISYFSTSRTILNKSLLMECAGIIQTGKFCRCKNVLRDFFCINQIHRPLALSYFEWKFCINKCINFSFIVGICIYLVTAKLCLTKGWKNIVSYSCTHFHSLAHEKHNLSLICCHGQFPSELLLQFHWMKISVFITSISFHRKLKLNLRYLLSLNIVNEYIFSHLI